MLDTTGSRTKDPEGTSSSPDGPDVRWLFLNIIRLNRTNNRQKQLSPRATAGAGSQALEASASAETYSFVHGSGLAEIRDAHSMPSSVSDTDPCPWKKKTLMVVGLDAFAGCDASNQDRKPVHYIYARRAGSRLFYSPRPAA